MTFLTKGSRPRRERFERFSRPERPQPVNPFNTQPSTDSSDFIQATVILGGFNRKCSSQQFRGGDLTAIMGGGKIDLRDAQIERERSSARCLRSHGRDRDSGPARTGSSSHGLLQFSADSKIAPTTQDKQGTQRLAIHGTTIMGGITVTN